MQKSLRDFESSEENFGRMHAADSEHDVHHTEETNLALSSPIRIVRRGIDEQQASSQFTFPKLQEGPWLDACSCCPANEMRMETLYLKIMPYTTVSLARVVRRSKAFSYAQLPGPYELVV